MKPLDTDENHFRETHARWARPYVEKPDQQKDEIGLDQCEFCAYYLALSGKFADDWGVCSNPLSAHDGRVMFEHDGCPFYEEVDVEF